MHDQFLPNCYVRCYLWISTRLIVTLNLYLIFNLFQLYSRRHARQIQGHWVWINAGLWASRIPRISIHRYVGEWLLLGANICLLWTFCRHRGCVFDSAIGAYRS